MLTFLNLQDEVIATRFKPGQRLRIQRWINVCEQKIWDAADWPFKFAYDQTLTVTSGSRNASYAFTDFNRPIAIRDTDGIDLDPLSNKEFEAEYGEGDVTGTPCHFTVVNRVVRLGPTPDATESFEIDYERRLAHYVAAGTVAVGPLSLDDDYPLYDEAFHYGLVFGASALGLKLENDDTWGPLESEFRETIGAMHAHYFPTQLRENRSYG